MVSPQPEGLSLVLVCDNRGSWFSLTQGCLQARGWALGAGQVLRMAGSVWVPRWLQESEGDACAPDPGLCVAGVGQLVS